MKKIILLFAFFLTLNSILYSQSTLKKMLESVTEIESLQHEITTETSSKYKKIDVIKVDSLASILITNSASNNIPTERIVEFQTLSDSLSYQLFLEGQLLNSIIQSLNRVFVTSIFLNRNFTSDFILMAKKTKDNSVKVYCIESINSKWLEIIAYKNNINSVIEANKSNPNIALLSAIFIDFNTTIDKLNEEYFKAELRKDIKVSNDKANNYLELIHKGITVHSEELVSLTTKCSKSLSELYSMNYRKLELTVPNEIFSIINSN